VIEIHDIIRVAVMTIRARNPLCLPNPTAITLNPLLLKLKVVGLVLLVILALIGTMASTTPMLRLAVGPNTKIRFG
jgi:hypothetical protein